MVSVFKNPGDLSGETKIVVLLDEYSIIVDNDKISMLTDKTNRKISQWHFNSENNQFYTYDNRKNIVYLPELITKTNSKYNTYSFINNNHLDLRLKNIIVTNNFIKKIEDDVIYPLKYNILCIIKYVNDRNTKKQDLNIKNIIWLVLTPQNEKLCLLYLVDSKKIVEFSYWLLDRIIKVYEKYDTVWYYSQKNRYIMSKSPIGKLYLHLVLSNNIKLNRYQVIYIDNNNLNNRIENLRCVHTEMPLVDTPTIEPEQNVLSEKPPFTSHLDVVSSTDDNINLTHPVYGSYKINYMYDAVYNKHTELLKNIKIILMDNNDGCKIYDAHTEQFYNMPYNWFLRITKNHETCRYSIHRLMLMSVFPNTPDNETVDHIDNDHTNNNINNLQWMSRSENSRKGQQSGVEKTNQNGGKNGAHILMKKKHPDFKDDHTKAYTIGTFRSIAVAAAFIKEHYKKDISNKSLESKISRAIKNPSFSVYKFHFELFNNDLSNEIWKPVPSEISEDKGYLVSSHGRAKNKHGVYVKQFISRYSKKYKYLSINGNHYSVHRLVWMTFLGKIPDDKVILHDDLAPLTDEGCYRNYLEDLRLDSQSENMFEYYMCKDVKPNETSQDFSKFVEEPPLIKNLGLPPKPQDEVDALMQNPPKYIQYVCAKNRGSKYIIGRNCPNASGTDISSSTSTKVSDRDKFLQIMKKYNELMSTNYLSAFIQ
jgi:hypothetical protein